MTAEVEVGDCVSVSYVRTVPGPSEEERTGEVVETHEDAFVFEHESGGDGWATRVQDHEKDGETLYRRVSEVVWEESPAGAYVHSLALNRGRSHPEETEVTVL